MKEIILSLLITGFVLFVIVFVPTQGERVRLKMLPLCDKYSGIMKGNLTCYLNTDNGVIPFSQGGLIEFDYRSTLFSD